MGSTSSFIRLISYHEIARVAGVTQMQEAQVTIYCGPSSAPFNFFWQ